MPRQTARNRFNGEYFHGRGNHVGLTGQIIEITDPSGQGCGFTRTLVVNQSAEEMSRELVCNYVDKAFMSFDGMFRPVSMDGEGGFPQYCRPTDNPCDGCSGETPGSFILTIAGVTGNPDINGEYTFIRGTDCAWSNSDAELGGAANINYDDVSDTWQLALGIGPTTSNTIAGQIDCLNPTQFVFGNEPPGYTGGTYTAQGVREIKLDDLNPWTNPGGFQRSHVATERTNTPTTGHDLELVSRIGDAREQTPVGGLGMVAAGHRQGDTGCEAFDYTDDYRFMALKGPLVIHGWGYDCDGRPIPNLNDTEANASSGVFETDNLDDNLFLDDFLRKPKTWPVAPVDLRFDRERCVWTTCGTGTGGTVTADCDSVKSAFGFGDDPNHGLAGSIWVPAFRNSLNNGGDASLADCDLCRVVKCGENGTAVPTPVQAGSTPFTPPGNGVDLDTTPEL